METYSIDDGGKPLDIYFCIEFSNTTMQDTDLISIERELFHFIESKKVKFAINYNTLTTIYLNARIYSYASVVLLSGQLVEKSLENYSNSSLIDVYTKVAKLYNQEVIGLDVYSPAIYELLFQHGVRKMGGKYITKNIEEDKITNKAILNELNTIENRKY